eukprot:TRINITY_DN47267_c0_g1_i1.p1 TRINITY_DN47267_c0_g1~~TRINITY_DN47267_c0_g1_i1.p1  ORF type:complete len:814 (-),score=226.41 TRINITY_DN47267_c0_g1_i1:115-2556(-)
MAAAAADHAKYLRENLQGIMEALVMSILDDRPDKVDLYALDWLCKYQAGLVVGPGDCPAAKTAALGIAGMGMDVPTLEAERASLQRTREGLLQQLSVIRACEERNYLASQKDAAQAEEAALEAATNEPPAPSSSAPVAPVLPEAVSQAAAATPPESVAGDSTPQHGRENLPRQDSVAEQDAVEMAKVARMKDKERRQGVSAQAITEERMKEWKKPFFAKSDEEKAKLKEIIAISEKLQVLFGHLNDEDINSVIDAFSPKNVDTGESIIKQGEEGDFFYIVDSGAFDVFVKRQGGEDTKVLSELGSGACFGELALMYNAPRAATVTCCTSGRVWSLDRDSFQLMLVTAGNTKKKEYEGFLEQVDIFKTLTKFEMAQLSDMVNSELYDGGETIMQQGDEGNFLCIIEDGEAKAYICGAEGEVEVKHYNKPGDYFGEVALLTSTSRKATVRAVGQGCAVLTVSREDFDRVLGPIKDTISKNIDKYPQYADFIKQEADKEAAEEEERRKISRMKDKARRPGVSAQTISEERIKDWVKPSFQKSEGARENLRQIIAASDKLQVLFGHLKPESIYDVIDAMFPKEVSAGSNIITQGEEGDNFYIVDEGQFDVLVKRSEGPPVKVLDYGPGACFGELALMYNAPRAATVTATTSGKVWALDRESFQMMLVTSENTKRKEYEGFLENVDIFKDLTKYELSQLSDLLEMECFDAGEDIIRQGDTGDIFYIVDDGEARAYISGEEGEIEVKRYSQPGDYFGEIALLTDAQRRASVRAAGTGCSVLSVSRADFDRVLGPIKDLLSKQIDKYPQYAQFLDAPAGK